MWVLEMCIEYKLNQLYLWFKTELSNLKFNFMKLLSFALLFMITMSVLGQEVQEISLWPKGAPEESGMLKAEEHLANGIVANVKEAKLYVYLPEKSRANGMAVLICPGGGYGRLAMNHEGYDVAKWLNSLGIAGVVLQYRMPNQHSEIPLTDAKEAMAVIRRSAVSWGIQPNKVGVCGFSAGGHLASTLSVRADSVNRPNFSILFYPVISMKDGVTHRGSRENLIGFNPDESTVKFYSNELQVSKDTPPTLFILADDDKAVVPENSMLYYRAMKSSGVAAAMYLFPTGGHGFGFKPDYKYHQQMKALMSDWLGGVLKK